MNSCACPATDSRACVRLQYAHRPNRSPLDLDADVACEMVSCGCACHDEDFEEDDDGP